MREFPVGRVFTKTGRAQGTKYKKKKINVQYFFFQNVEVDKHVTIRIKISFISSFLNKREQDP